MGSGYSYKCKNCHYEFFVHPGSGMGYPTEYRETLTSIAEGAYGEERKELVKKTPYAAINAEKVIYVCGACNRWELGIDVTLYAPNDVDSISKKQYGDKLVEEWGGVPYVTSWDLKEDYHCIKRYYHKCEKCGRRMHKASFEEEQKLTCPKCGSQTEILDYIRWD